MRRTPSDQDFRDLVHSGVAGPLGGGVVVVSDKGNAYLVVATRYELEALRRQQ